MKSKRLLILLLLALLVPWAAHAQQQLLTENFDNMSSLTSTYSATGWYTYNAGNGNNWTLNSYNGVSSSKCARYGYNYYNAANCYLVSAPFSVGNSFTSLNVSLYECTSGSYNETFEVFFVKASELTDLASVATATQYMAIASATYNNSTYQERTGSSTSSALAGQNVRLVIHCTSAANMNWLTIDDITVTLTSTVPYISLDPTSATILTGFSETLTATYGNVTDPTIDYTSSNPSVATVSGSGTTATVTAVAPGTATITATMNGTYTATCEVTVEDPHYCTPVFTGTDNTSYITNFTTTGAYSNINNTSTGTGLAYSDYYDTKSASAYEGMTVGFTVTYVGGSAGVAIWVDWNNDFDFTDDGERVYNTTGYKNSPHSGSFTIPDGALLGDHRMRVVIDWNNSNPADPCTASRGEYEDYKLTIIEVPDCLPVNALTVDEPNVTATQIPIRWTAGSTETSWNIRWRKYGTTSAYSTETVNTTSYTIPGLTALTKYEFGVQAGCDVDNVWVDGSYTTACPDYYETPFTQNFNSLTSGIPQCWDNTEGTTTYASYKWNYNYSGHSGACVSFNSYYNTSGYDNYLKTPVISLPSDQDMQLSFWYKNSSTNSTNQFIVYIATEDDDYATRTALTDNLKGKSSWTEHAPIDLSTYRGKKIMLLFYGKSAYDYTYMYLDDVTLRVAPDCETPTGLALKSGSQTPEGATIVWNPGNASSWFVEYKKNSESEYTAIATPVADTFYTFMGLDANTPYNARIKVNCTTGTGITYPTDPVSFTTAKACPAPKNLVVSNVTGTSATLAWTPGYNETEWTVKYKVSDSTTYITAPTVSGTPTITLTGLDGGTSYDVQIIGCDVANVYTVTRAFTTAFTAPYLQAFAASSIPAGWNNYSTLLAPEVLNGTTPLSGSGSWIFSNTNVFGAYHAKLNIYGDNYCKSWLLTPNIVVGSGQVLSFDLALTDYDNADPIEDTTAQSDDKFIVLVSTNNGTTWSILRQWDNAGSQYVYNRIATAGETVYIDMAGFSGQTVRVAFYGESTIAGNGDNDLHIDNVSIDLPPTCYRPLGLTASDVTNHSAKLSWTAGTEDQTAWQIAYRKGTTFNPADTTLDWTTVTIVDVTTNPYTFVKTLDAASTYYMYVRANCGDEEYSEWCRKVCSFTTKAAAPAPTNFQKTDVGPDFATLTWKAGGGDYEANYDLYVVQSATTPATPTIDTVPTIAGITELPTAENPYLLDGLDNEKRYYVWVRANHVHPDTTIHSAWVAISGSYFTTLVNCPIPATANVTNVTPHTATLNWTGYSEEYNVRYRTAKSEDPIYSEDFEQGIPATWTLHAEGEVPTSVPNGWTTTTDNGSTVAVSYSWLSGSGNMDADNWLITPSVSLQGMLKFDVRRYSEYYDEDYEVLLSTTGTEIADFTVVLRELDAAPYTWTEFSYDLSSYAGQQGYIAIRHNFSGGYNLMVDNFRIVNMIPAGEWTDATNPIAALTTDIQSLSDSTNYEWQVQATCAVDPENPEAGWSASGYFTTLDACTAPVADSATNITYNSADLYWTGYQENYNVRYRVSAYNNEPLFTEDFADGELGDWTTYNLNSITYYGTEYTSGVEEGYFDFITYEATSPQYLVSPELEGLTEGGYLYFDYMASYSTIETFKVGFSSTTNEVNGDAFTWSKTYTVIVDEDEDYTLGSVTIEIPAGTKYFAIQSTTIGYDGNDFLVSDFMVFGPAGEWQYANNVTSPATITGLEDDTWYEWQVQGLGECTDGTDWSESDYFETLPLPTQTIELAEGWNWVSFYVTNEDPEEMMLKLQKALGENGLTITNGDDYTTYEDGEWGAMGELEELNNEQMYMIEVSADCTVEMQGELADPEDYTIYIYEGWNWIGFPSAVAMSIEDAFADFEAEEGDMITNGDDFTTYEDGEWGAMGDLEEMTPGMGFMYLSNSEDVKELVFPVASRSRANAGVRSMSVKPHIGSLKINTAKPVFRLSKTAEVKQFKTKK